MKSKGSWTTIRMVIYILIVMAAVFIGLSEPEFFNNFTSFIAVIAGIITVLPSLGSLFSVSKEDKL